MPLWLQNTVNTIPEAWTTEWLNTDIDPKDMFLIEDEKEHKDSIINIYDKKYIYCNQRQNKDYNDLPIDIWVCILFATRYVLNLAIYAEIAGKTWSVIIFYK